jgi:hypothetical protein
LAIDNNGVFVIRHNITTGVSNNYNLNGTAPPAVIQKVYS